MAITIGKVVEKTKGIGANAKWELYAADADTLKLKSVEEPTIKWIGTYDQYAEIFSPLI